MSRLTLAILATWLVMVASPASAYVWRCHTPNGDVWTSQPPQYGDCEEYDGTFNPGAAPSATPPVHTLSLNTLRHSMFRLPHRRPHRRCLRIRTHIRCRILFLYRPGITMADPGCTWVSRP